MYTDLIYNIAKIHKTGAESREIDGWFLKRAANGLNGVVYQAQNTEDNLAVKFAKRDQRRRAWREFTITKAIHEAGVNSICAQPLYLHPEDPDLPGDVLISTWLPGEPMVTPPPAEGRTRWEAILETLAQAHSLTPEKSAIELPNAVMHVQHPKDLLDILQTRFAHFPEGQYGELAYEQIAELIDRLVKIIPHQWNSTPPLTLIHCDSHPANMIEHQGKVWLVDWEGAGWSDPAFDINNITSQWRYADLPQEHFEWLHTKYAQLTHDPWLPERVHIYSIIQHVQWVVTLSSFVRQGLGKQIEGTHQHSVEHNAKYQMHHWNKSRQLLQFN